MTDTESMKTGELIDEVKARLAQKNSAFEGLLGRLEELRSERYDLICKRDRWQTRAESAEARVEELTEEQDRDAAMRAREERDGWQRLCVKVTEERDDLRAENARLEHDNSILHREREVWMEIAEDLADHLDRLRTAVPRVIRPDELRDGQTVVFSNHNNESDWIVEVVEWETRFASEYNGTIVLLADPRPEYADEEDDFPCCRIRQTGICEGDG